MKGHSIVRVDSIHGAKYASTMAIEAPAGPATAHGAEPSVVEALIEEARRARRRRYLRSALVVALAAVLVLVGWLTLGGGWGAIGGLGSLHSAQPPGVPATPVSQTAPPNPGTVGRGPSSVDFPDPAHGWIASGNVALPLGNPTIVRTTNGGQTWQRTPVPNLAVQSVNSATRFALGGLVIIHFSDSARGWFSQAGIAWQTNDGGMKWTKTHFPVEGAVVALTSSSTDVWALRDTCPVGASSCPQTQAKGFLFHATSAASLTWRRVGNALPGGIGTLYPVQDHRVEIALGPTTYLRSADGSPGGSGASGCQTIGSLTGGALAGVCGGAGGGDASVSSIAVSKDRAATWQPLVGGPPSSQFMGTLSTNGSNAVFYVTGGQTLWRTSAARPGWTAVLEAPRGSTDEIYPVFVHGADGLALLSNGLDAHWFGTIDGGITWAHVALP